MSLFFRPKNSRAELSQETERRSPELIAVPDSGDSKFPRMDEIKKLLTEVELEASDEAWADFLHSVAHEIQGPLGTLGTSLELMNRVLDAEYNSEPSVENMRSMARLCRRHFERLDKLVESLLELPIR